jgi:hypothetical protein
MIDSQHMIGAHRIDVEGASVVCRYQGPISLEEILRVHDVLEAVLSKEGRCYQLIDMHAVKTLGPEERRWVSQWAKTHTLEAVLCFRASSLMFHLVGLMARAIYFLRQDKRPIVLVLKDEAEARAMVGELEARRRAKDRPAIG